MEQYVCFHLHSEYSLLDSCSSFKDYINKAKELNQPAICFSEHGHIMRWVAKKKACEESGIKYLHGIEIYLTENLEPKIRDNYHTILIAKNEKGVKELNKLVTLSNNQNHFYFKPRISFDEFLSISDNIISTSACLASPLNKLDKDNKYYNLLCEKYDYYEVQPHIESLEQKEFNKKLLDLSKKYNKPIIAGTDTHSINKYKAECRSIMQLAKGIEYSDEDDFDLAYKSYNELVEMFKKQEVLSEKEYLIAIENTVVLADSIQDFKLDYSFKYPKISNDDINNLKKNIIKSLKSKVSQGIINKDEEQIYKDRIKEEFIVFKEIEMCGFLLFMSELISWCKQENIPFGYARGSVAGSLIAYILDITDVDPIKWKTVFSRFANKYRKEIGDIDIDFAPSDREKVYNHVIEKFGEKYTSYILAIGTISHKGTIDEIGRALSYKHPNNDMFSLSNIAKIKKDYDFNPEETREKYPEIFYYFDGMINTAISQSMHPAGIIVSPISLSDNYGCLYKDGKKILQLDMEDVHDVSLVKCDILGLINIEIIKNTCSLVGINYPMSHDINWDDNKVWQDMLKSHVGIFQFEGDYAFSMLKAFMPQSIFDMSLITAALRPSGASYRDKLLKKEFNKNPSKIIDDLLKDNYGYLAYQEDTLRFLQEICGLSGSDADNIRRAIGRKQKDRLQKALPDILDGYCNKSDKPRNIAEEEAKQFLQVLEDSAEYQFGYNHSVSYCMIGYTCAYLRYYYPIEFVTSYLNNVNNEDDIMKGLELAKVYDIKILPPLLGKSRAEYFMDKKNKSVYKGIASIKFLNKQVSEELYEIASENRYVSFIDLYKDILFKTALNSRQFDILIKCDYFKQFGSVSKLLYLYNECKNGKNRINKTIKDETLIKRIKDLKELEKSAIIEESFTEIDSIVFKAQNGIDYSNHSTSYDKRDFIVVNISDFKNSNKTKATIYRLYNKTLWPVKFKNGMIQDVTLDVYDYISVSKIKEENMWHVEIIDGEKKWKKYKDEDNKKELIVYNYSIKKKMS